MTAVPPPVPPEIVEKAERAVLAMQNSPAVVTGSVYVLARVVAERVLAAVYGDIVEAARRDALQSLWDDVHADLDRHATTYGEDQRFRDGMAHAAAKVLWLRDAAAWLRDATAPPRAPTASVSDQGADPRTPTTPGAQIGVQSDD